MDQKKRIALALSATMTLSVAAPAFAAEEPVSLIAPAPETPWYTEAQTYVTERGIMAGTDQGFAPLAATDRASVFQTLWNLEGKPEPVEMTAPEGDIAFLAWNTAKSIFEDSVAGKWYEPAAKWAYSVRLTTGNEHFDFSGERNITRAEVATVFSRYMENKGMEHWNSSLMEKITDAEDIAGWALDGFENCIAWGILTGDGDIQSSAAAIHPNQHMTRAELAAMLMRFDQVAEPAGTAVSRATGISKYGNVTTGATLEKFDALGFAPGDILAVTVGDQTIDVPFGTGYSNVDTGKEIALPTSDGYIAVAINMGDFAKTYGVEEGSRITFAMGEKEGYLEEYTIRNIDALRTNQRFDYASDMVFANFRPIVLGDIAEGRLFRSSSPVNPELGRNIYADAFAKVYGIKTILDLADSDEERAGYEGFAKTYASTTNTVCLNMGVDFTADDFAGKLKTGLEYMIAHEGPYLVHCNEGKDRAGFVSMLLECLMGGTLDEVVADYMLTYENYYHVERDSDRWERIAESNVIANLMRLTGAEDRAALEKADLREAAEAYLTDDVGLTDEQIADLRDALHQ